MAAFADVMDTILSPFHTSNLIDCHRLTQRPLQPAIPITHPGIVVTHPVVYP